MPDVRYMQKGITKFWFFPAITGTGGAPDVSTDLPDADDVTRDVAEVSGFNFANDPIETPDMENTFTPSIPGRDKADSSSLTYYDRLGLANNPNKTLMAKGVVGYLVIFPYGLAGATPAAGDECDVWPIQVASVSRGYSAANEAAKNVFMYTITDAPVLDTEMVA